MSDELNPYPGNLKHHKVDEATANHLRIIANQAELIQRLVDAIEPADCHHPYCQWVTNRTLDCDCHMAALSIAAAAGFKPSDR